jgi:hypothetical protein
MAIRMPTGFGWVVRELAGRVPPRLPPGTVRMWVLTPIASGAKSRRFAIWHRRPGGFLGAAEHTEACGVLSGSLAKQASCTSITCSYHAKPGVMDCGRIGCEKAASDATAFLGDRGVFSAVWHAAGRRQFSLPATDPCPGIRDEPDMARRRNSRHPKYPFVLKGQQGADTATTVLS